MTDTDSGAHRAGGPSNCVLNFANEELVKKKCYTVVWSNQNPVSARLLYRI
jgi:hypothetical protein